MTTTLRTLALAIMAYACVDVAPPALAAGRLTTAAAYLGDYSAHCRIAYFGQQTNVAVKVTLVGYATSKSPELISRLFKLGPNNRAAQLSLRCNPAGGAQGCQDTRCVFDIQHPSEPPLQFSGTACGPDHRWVNPGQGDCVAAK